LTRVTSEEEEEDNVADADEEAYRVDDG